jgi:hypothetical protein
MDVDKELEPKRDAGRMLGLWTLREREEKKKELLLFQEKHRTNSTSPPLPFRISHLISPQSHQNTTHQQQQPAYSLQPTANCLFSAVCVCMRIARIVLLTALLFLSYSYSYRSCLFLSCIAHRFSLRVLKSKHEQFALDSVRALRITGSQRFLLHGRSLARGLVAVGGGGQSSWSLSSLNHPPTESVSFRESRVLAIGVYEYRPTIHAFSNPDAEDPIHTPLS